LQFSDVGPGFFLSQKRSQNFTDSWVGCQRDGGLPDSPSNISRVKPLLRPASPVGPFRFLTAVRP